MFFVEEENAQAVEALEASELADALVTQEMQTFAENSENDVLVKDEAFQPVEVKDLNIPQEVLNFVDIIEQGDVQVVQFLELVPNYVGDPSNSQPANYEQKFYIGEIPCFVLSTCEVRDYSSLNENEWVAETVINDYANYVIGLYNQHSTILYMPADLYRGLMKDKLDTQGTEILIKFLANHRALEKDILMVCIPSDGDDKHLMLGLIYLNTKRITILDSKQTDISISVKHFDFLLRIVAVIHKAYGIQFRQDQWTSYFPTKIQRQSNDYDCGIFVCSFIHQVVSNTKVAQMDTMEGRQRIRYVLSNCITIDKPKQEDLCTPAMVNLLSPTLSESFQVRIIQLETFENIRRNRSQPPQAKQYCLDRFCVRLLTAQPDLQQFFCFGCRGWYHNHCMDSYDPSTSYWACADCKV